MDTRCGSRLPPLDPRTLRAARTTPSRTLSQVLLSAAALLARRRLVVGVTHETLLEQKALRPLIEPRTLRAAAALEFVRSVRPGLRCESTWLCDPMGPAATDAALGALVVSEETRSGAAACNAARCARGLPELALQVVPLLGADDGSGDDSGVEGEGESGGEGGGEDSGEGGAAAAKLSSSNLRAAALGRFVPRAAASEWVRRRPASWPYVVGLTGGIASGKSSASAALSELGAECIDADRLAHELYVPGGRAVAPLRTAFGPGVIAADGSVDRRALGARVFGDAEEMAQLTAIVWPLLLRRIARRVREVAAQREARGGEAGGGAECDGAGGGWCGVVVVEAAVLVEAGWDAWVDEVWAMVLRPSEQQRRLMARDQLSDAQAAARMAAQLPPDMVAARAQVRPGPASALSPRSCCIALAAPWLHPRCSPLHLHCTPTTPHCRPLCTPLCTTTPPAAGVAQQRG